MESSDKCNIDSMNSLLNYIEDVIYDDTENGMLNDLKREGGRIYVEGFNSGINYVQRLISMYYAHMNSHHEISEEECSTKGVFQHLCK